MPLKELWTTNCSNLEKMPIKQFNFRKKPKKEFQISRPSQNKSSSQLATKAMGFQEKN